MTVHALDAVIADPLISAPVGPVTRSRITRTLGTYGVLLALGLAPLVLGSDQRLVILGQGLWLPGGGFLAAGGWAVLLFPLTLVVFALSVFLWFGAGLAALPVIVWLGAAALAGAVAPLDAWSYGPLVNAALVAAFAAWRVRGWSRSEAAERAVFDRRSAALPANLTAARAAAVDAPPAAEREHSPEALQSLRYALDRALQPLERWDGFDVIDEFQSSARRYQVQSLSYALSLAQMHYTPSFHGYLSQAGRNLIDKYRRPEVWRYWIYETIGGHLNFTNFDPAGKDNIMMSAFFAKMVGLYMSATGDLSYAEPGSLEFRLNSRTRYRHDIHTIVGSLLTNFRSSAFCLYPCEPNWVFPICNHYGVSSLKLYDRLFGTSYFDEVFPHWLHGVDSEFTGRSGTIIGVRSNYTGFQFKFPAGDLGLAVITNGFMPARAERMWATARADLQAAIAPDEMGQPVFRTSGPGFDGGHYRAGHGRTLAIMANVAQEFGDVETAAAVLTSLDRLGGRREDGGVLRFTEVSNLGNGSAVQARVNRRNFWRDAINDGPSAHLHAAPILAEANYPEVQVAKAYSDGADLQLVLYPGGTDTRQTIGLARLQPGRRYAVAGGPAGEFVADADGHARLTVALAGRTPLHVTPLS